MRYMLRKKNKNRSQMMSVNDFINFKMAYKKTCLKVKQVYIKLNLTFLYKI